MLVDVKFLGVNKKDFFDIIKNPNQVNFTAKSALLSEIAAEFPYFQTAHILYLKSLQVSNSINYPQYLKKASAYASDRTLLYQFIHGSNAQTIAASYVSTVSEQINNNKVEQKTILQPETGKIDETAITSGLETKPEPTVITEKQELAETPLLAKVMESAVKIKEHIPASKITITAQDEINKAIQGEIQSNEAETIINKDVVVDVKKMSPVAKEIISKAVDSSINQEINEAVASNDLKEETVIESESSAEVDANEEHDFLYWLKKPADRNSESNKKKAEYEDLIGKFIKEDPKISKPTATFYSPVDKAKQSVTEDYSFVTETLARIYFTQGAFEKALKSYQALSLKYPEKKHTFAAQIEEIKKHINNS